jgi:hypothetical protein
LSSAPFRVSNVMTVAVQQAEVSRVIVSMMTVLVMRLRRPARPLPAART